MYIFAARVLVLISDLCLVAECCLRCIHKRLSTGHFNGAEKGLSYLLGIYYDLSGVWEHHVTALGPCVCTSYYSFPLNQQQESRHYEHVQEPNCISFPYQIGRRLMQ